MRVRARLRASHAALTCKEGRREAGGGSRREERGERGKVRLPRVTRVSWTRAHPPALRGSVCVTHCFAGGSAPCHFLRFLIVAEEASLPLLRLRALCHGALASLSRARPLALLHRDARRRDTLLRLRLPGAAASARRHHRRRTPCLRPRPASRLAAAVRATSRPPTPGKRSRLDHGKRTLLVSAPAGSAQEEEWPEEPQAPLLPQRPQLTHSDKSSWTARG